MHLGARARSQDTKQPAAPDLNLHRIPALCGALVGALASLSRVNGEMVMVSHAGLLCCLDYEERPSFYGQILSSLPRLQFPVGAGLLHELN